MTIAVQTWETWLQDERLDDQMRRELDELVSQDQVAELKERFAQDLEFGTGGLRAKMGVGTSRLNIYTVRKATQGVVRWVQDHYPQEQWSIVVGFDGRNNSALFAKETASVAAACGVKAYVYEAERPTPMLSFAVRHLECAAGVMITASHNPAQYNGYKVYGADGGQILAEAASEIVGNTAAIKDLFGVATVNFADAQRDGRIQTVDQSVEDAYFANLVPLHRNIDAGVKADTVIVYTPLHGTGGAAVPRALAEAGFTHVVPVEKQANLDGNFTYVQSPNPEESVAYDLALQTAAACGADVILATDPDADRVGVMARDSEGQYVLLTGNEVGALLLSDYLQVLRDEGRLPQNATVVTTNVTSDFGAAVATSFGVHSERVLTGFKYIGDRIKTFAETGERTFVFGYEESVGYLALPFVRDKDSVQAALLVANMVANLKHKGASLLTAREELFQRFGFFRDRLLSYTFPGLTGLQQMNDFMRNLRAKALVAEDMPLVAVEDSLVGERVELSTGRTTNLNLPASDVLKFRYGGDAWVAVRPSGTEPKLKVYVGVKGTDQAQADGYLNCLLAAVEKRIQPLLGS